MPFDEKKTKFYGRRQGKKLRQSRIHLLNNLLPKIAISKEHLKDKLDINSLFNFIQKY